MFDERKPDRRMLEAGAKGYLLKECRQQEILEAMRMFSKTRLFIANTLPHASPP